MSDPDQDQPEPPAPEAAETPLDPAVLRIIEALAEWQAERDYAARFPEPSPEG
jgi:hypothetical protein